MKNKILNKHIPVMLEEIKKFITINKKINVIDATFGGGGYSREILKLCKVKKLIAIDRDPIANIFAKEIKKEYPNQFNLVTGCFSQIDQLILQVLSNKEKQTKFDIISFVSFVDNLVRFELDESRTIWNHLDWNALRW